MQYCAVKWSDSYTAGQSYICWASTPGVDVTQTLFDKLTQTPFAEQIAGRIESLILDAQLRPGDKLPPERELAAGFGVSRTAVRESLKLLQERGLVEVRNAKGAFVTGLKLESIASSFNVAYRMQKGTVENLHEARWSLESSIARLAAERATDADVARMEAALEVMDASLSEPPKYMPADAEFHCALAAATQNPLFLILIYPLVDMILSVGSMGFSSGGVAERHQYHRRLLECVKNRDASGAEEAIQQLLVHGRQAIQSANLSDATVS